MTTKNEPQCGFCGGTEFRVYSHPKNESMEVACARCNLWLSVFDDEPNRSTAIEQYVAYTERLAMQILKNNVEVTK